MTLEVLPRGHAKTRIPRRPAPLTLYSHRAYQQWGCNQLLHALRWLLFVCRSEQCGLLVQRLADAI